MALVKTIAKHGNSAGIILDQTLLKVLGWEIGTDVELQIKGHSIVLTRHKMAAPILPATHESPDK